MTIAEDSIAHLDALAAILRELMDDGIAMYEHNYHPMAFGSFTVVLGRAHIRVKFDWDGRENILTVSFSRFSEQGSVPDWVHDMDVSLPNAKGLYEEIASNATNMLEI